MREICRTNRRSHFIFKRRYMVTLLGFLCSVVMHSQRLNISIAMVAMVNATNPLESVSIRNSTECPREKIDEMSSKGHNGEFFWNPELQGYILSAGYLGYLMGQIPGGILAGRFGTKPILLAGLLAASICNLLSPVSARLHPFLLAFVQLIRGIGQGLQQPSMSVLMSKWFPRNERGFLSAFIYCGYPMGAFITSIVSGLLCEMDFLGGWPLVFYTFGLVGVIVSLILIFFYVERPSDDLNITESELRYIITNQERGASIPRRPTPWGCLLTSISTYALILALFGQYWMAFYFLSVHPTYMGTILHIPIKENGILSSGPYFAQAVVGFGACILAFWLSKNRGAKVNTVRKGCNTLSCGIFTLGTIGVYLSGCDSMWNEICLFVATASVGFGFGGSLIAAVDMSPTFCGPLMGFASTVASLAGFAVPVIVGTLTNGEQTLAQWRKIFIITSTVAAGSGIVFLTLGSTDIQPYDPAHKSVQLTDSTKRKNKEIEAPPLDTTCKT
ncbi:hypothetical protein JTE90_023399 [Oedothorax gibbosus]|uniref:Major facilitator superfamily (MFS) profile domain-containing protein n=1 Tax=Oedothorax gibbosus TaxID=931172 RepID=A0AAV6UF12_9ARAC|nr:hypothetical protein JTE90_023399 [Oedothorax gibbosus]